MIVFLTGNNSGLSKPNQLRMEDITMPQGTVIFNKTWVIFACSNMYVIILSYHHVHWGKLSVASYLHVDVAMQYTLKSFIALSKMSSNWRKLPRDRLPKRWQ